MFNDTFPCPRCQVGRCQPELTTYVRLVEGRIISAPNTPAYLCDVCGYHEFDYDAIEHVQKLIGLQKEAAEERPQQNSTTRVDRTETPPPPKP